MILSRCQEFWKADVKVTFVQLTLLHNCDVVFQPPRGNKEGCDIDYFLHFSL